jgi:predicted RNA binding protein YcfA (HicA-like mRNA interferase family)
MSALKPVRWQKLEKVILELGCVFVHQKGGHRVYRKADLVRPIIIPAHSTEVPIFIIKNNLRLLEVSNEKYKEILRKIR